MHAPARQVFQVSVAPAEARLVEEVAEAAAEHAAAQQGQQWSRRRRKLCVGCCRGSEHAVD